jgi:hypothetical protein
MCTRPASAPNSESGREFWGDYFGHRAASNEPTMKGARKGITSDSEENAKFLLMLFFTYVLGLRVF